MKRGYGGGITYVLYSQRPKKVVKWCPKRTVNVAFATAKESAQTFFLLMIVMPVEELELGRLNN